MKSKYVNHYPSAGQRMKASLKAMWHALTHFHRTTHGYNEKGELILLVCADCPRRFLN